MTGEIETRRLGDLIHLDVTQVKVEPDATYPILGVLNRGRGLLRREPIRGADTKYARLHRVHPEQVIYSRLKAFEGAVTVVPRDVFGYSSPEFPTFTCGPEILPGFMRLITTMGSFWQALEHQSKGMGGRRERVGPEDFLSISIQLPSIDSQRRIVDLIDHLDVHVARLRVEAEALEATRVGILIELLAGDLVIPTSYDSFIADEDA